MSALPKYTLSPGKKDGWDLRRDGSNRRVAHFETKAEAIKGGVLEAAVNGKGSVKIQKADGKIQEERTYPRSADPASSPG